MFMQKFSQHKKIILYKLQGVKLISHDSTSQNIDKEYNSEIDRFFSVVSIRKSFRLNFLNCFFLTHISYTGGTCYLRIRLFSDFKATNNKGNMPFLAYLNLF